MPKRTKPSVEGALSRIYLLGFMGSGKTYLGRRLADHLGYAFVDLDEEIASWTRQSIADFFAANGEHAFRLLEQKALQATVWLEHSVIGTGGGTPCFFDNMEWINQHGVSIYLETPVDLLVKRLLPEQSKRPLLAGLKAEQLTDFILRKMEDRTPFYLQAHLIFRNSGEMPDAARFLEEKLEEFQRHWTDDR